MPSNSAMGGAPFDPPDARNESVWLVAFAVKTNATGCEDQATTPPAGRFIAVEFNVVPPNVTFQSTPGSATLVSSSAAW
jgi:hypothetical protein